MNLSTHATLQGYIDTRFDAAQTKPVVRYLKDEIIGIDTIAEGHRASVFAIDHPVLGQGFVSTSLVLSYDRETGHFETLNTIYVPLVLDKQAEAVVE